MAMPDSQQCLCNLYLINNVEDIEVFLGLKSVLKKLELKKISFQNFKHCFLNVPLSDKIFEGGPL